MHQFGVRRWGVLLTALLFAVAIYVVVPQLGGTATADSAITRLTGDSSIVEDGRRITFHGSGFASRERISTWLTLPDQSVISSEYFSSDKAGEAVLEVPIQRYAASGTWHLTAYGIRSQTPATIQFTVLGVDPSLAAAVSAVWPAQAPAGTSFRFVGYGFGSEEYASFWITAPDGSIPYALSRSTQADSNGTIAIDYAVPTVWTSGRYVLTIQGIKTGTARAIVFDVAP